MASDIPARQAEPGWMGEWRDERGRVVTLKADKEGLVHPRDHTEARAAEAFGLRVAGKSKQADKAAADAADTKE